MKEDKYCYELPRYTTVPRGFDPVDIARAQRLIGDYLEREKHFRRSQRQNALSTLRNTLDAAFAKRVKKEQEARKKQLEAGFKDRGNRLHAVHREMFPALYPGGGGAPTGAQIAGSKYLAPVRSDMYRATGYMPEIQHKHYDPVIEQFEQAYVDARPDVNAIRASIKRLLARMPFYIVSDAGSVRVYLLDRGGDEELLVATLYLGDFRFALKAPATSSTRAVHAHIGNGREYVRDANGVFVKRYVYRNMSLHDDPWTKGGFLSRNGRVPPGSDMNDVILKHLRAAEQGSSYFISFTTTRNPIFGSTGDTFYDPVKGQVIVDLARVDQARIYDVHSAKAVNQVITTSDLRWGVQFDPGAPAYEKNAAARDTVRTRELLVEEKVPASAIVSIRKADKHGGEWRDLDGTTIQTNAFPADLFPVG